MAITAVYVTPQWIEELEEAVKSAFKRLKDMQSRFFTVDASVFEAMSAEDAGRYFFVCTADKFDTSEKFFEKNAKKREKCLSYVILDDVQDPGIVGTIIRTADAHGFGRVLSAQQNRRYIQ